MATLTSAEVEERLEDVQTRLYNARLHAASEVGSFRSEQEQQVSALIKIETALQLQYNAIKSFTVSTDM